uniref:Uncharacterized protein LOC114325877 n=1 Tax=Diabrotica virgifera virgifera TaxID=50390 RepID=A0A6P7F2F6_DIAVI
MKSCCDPFDCHTKNITTDLRVLNLETFEKGFDFVKFKITPGQKICKRCESTIRSQLKSEKDIPIAIAEELVSDACSSNVDMRVSERMVEKEKVDYTEENFTSDSQSTHTSVGSIFTTFSQEANKVNTVLESLALPTMRNQQFYKTKRVVDAENLIDDVCKTFTGMLSKSENINISIPDPICNNTLEDSSVLRQILINLQKEFENEKDIYKKILILSMLPKDWSSSKISKHFRCTDYMLKKLSYFKEKDDFPENVKIYRNKVGFKISSEIKQLVINYYLNEEHVYTCPGKKDYVSVRDSEGKKIFIQKKMLLYTVHDVYLKFIEDYTGYENLPKFSYFASLKPAECIHAGDPGSHNICVCAEHQNVKLKLYALSRKLNYRSLIGSAVCSVDNQSCMLKECKNCPGKEKVLTALNDFMEIYDIAPRNTIVYKNWIEAGSRASLSTFEDNNDHFKLQLCKEIDDLTFHQYIADSQKNYLNHCKNNLELDTCIILMDFSENYSFIIQNSVQAFYYNNDQATVHPFCMYYRTEDKNDLLNVNYCVISDTKDHYAYTINAFTAKMMATIKQDFKWIKKVIYFSDGAPQQYKNKNHLANIACHEKDFGIKVTSYNYFATSHGKSVCDATGGSIKGQCMRHCIRSTPQDQITNALEMYNYGIEKVNSIRVLWVPDTDVKKYERKLRARFESAKTFPNTRKHHCYIPVNGNQMKMKITSFDVKEKSVSFKLN